jgi:hypothetical protein
MISCKTKNNKIFDKMIGSIFLFLHWLTKNKFEEGFAKLILNKFFKTKLSV